MYWCPVWKLLLIRSLPASDYFPYFVWVSTPNFWGGRMGGKHSCVSGEMNIVSKHVTEVPYVMLPNAWIHWCIFDSLFFLLRFVKARYFGSTSCKAIFNSSFKKITWVPNWSPEIYCMWFMVLKQVKSICFYVIFTFWLTVGQEMKKVQQMINPDIMYFGVLQPCRFLFLGKQKKETKRPAISVFHWIKCHCCWVF